MKASSLLHRITIAAVSIVQVASVETGSFLWSRETLTGDWGGVRKDLEWGQ